MTTTPPASKASPPLYDRTWSPAADSWCAPIRWRKPSRILFVGAWSDFTDHGLDRVFAVMALANRHTFLIPVEDTNRLIDYMDTGLPTLHGHNDIHDRYRAVRRASHVTWERELCRKIEDLPSWSWPLPNVVPIALATTQAEVDSRVPHLLRCPAAYRGLWLRGLRERMDLRLTEWQQDGPDESPYNQVTTVGQGLAWVIVEGGDEPLHPNWVRGLRDQCQSAGAAFWFESFGEWADFDNPYDVCSDPRYKRKTMPQVFIEGKAFNRVGRARSCRELDGREWTQSPWDETAATGGQTR